MQELAEEKERALLVCYFEDLDLISISNFSKERTSLQEKIENDRRELEQTHSRNVRDMQQRLSELEETTKVCISLLFSNLIIFIQRN
jgi:hypothetical protein